MTIDDDDVTVEDFVVGSREEIDAFDDERSPSPKYRWRGIIVEQTMYEKQQLVINSAIEYVKRCNDLFVYDSSRPRIEQVEAAHARLQKSVKALIDYQKTHTPMLPGQVHDGDRFMVIA